MQDYFTIELTLYRQNLVIQQAQCQRPQKGAGFSQMMSSALVELCRLVHAPIPLWLDKNTREFSRFHQTLFFPEQFDETVAFDRMRLRLFHVEAVADHEN